MTSKHWKRICCVLILLIAPSIATAEPMGPMETLQVPIDKIITILNDPAYRGEENRSTQRDKIWEVTRPVFNFNEISRRAVGKPWKTFTDEEKARFIDVFSEFLGSTYIDKLQGEYSNERIEFDKELVKGSKALIRTRLLRKNLEIPIDYRMHRVDGVWKIYDILVENGVSLVKNYRVQFTSMLKEGTPAQLIERLEKKLAEEQKSKS